jgi:hypothetical protein
MMESFSARPTEIISQSIRTPRRRLALSLPLFTLLCFIGSLPIVALPIVALANALQPAAVAAALQTNFGSAVEASSAFKPFYVVGDFNGDGAQDIAAVVLIKAGRSALPKDVRLLNPFEFEQKIKYPAYPATANKLALAIIHGWRNPKPSGKYLLIGESPILILDHQRVTSAQPADRVNLIGLLNKVGRRPKGSTFPRGAKGDVILLGNQVGDNSPLYWNGRTYVWEDSAED